MQAAQSQINAGKEQLDAAKEQIQEQTDLHTLLTQDMIKGILAAENFAMPAGYVQEDKKDYLIRVGEKVQDIDALKDLIILDLGLEGLEPVKLSDVAEIQVMELQAGQLSMATQELCLPLKNRPDIPQGM